MKTLYLCKGARVFLTVNLNTSIGLFNSSQGTVIDIVYEENADTDVELPKYVLVDFTKYTDQIRESNVFPVYPQKIYDDDYRIRSRTQIPLLLSYALTSYRVQSKTLDKIVINLKKAES